MSGGEMDRERLDALTRQVTVFASWNELEARLRAGYCPTLAVGTAPSTTAPSEETSASVLAARELARAIEARGYRVFRRLASQ